MSQKAYKKLIAERNRIKRYISQKNKDISPKSKLSIDDKNRVMEEIKVLREQLQFIESDIEKMEMDIRTEENNPQSEPLTVEENTDTAPNEETVPEPNENETINENIVSPVESIENPTPIDEEQTTFSFSDDIFQVAPRIIENVIDTPETEKPKDVEFHRTKAEQDFVDAVLASEEKEVLNKFPTATAEKTENEKVKVKMPDGWTAQKIIDTFDKVQSIAFPFLYDFTLLTQEERALIRATAKKEPTLELIEDGKKRLIIDYTSEELNAIKKAEKIETYKEAIPLTQDEKSDLNIPLEEYLRDKGVELSPGWALVIVVATIMMSRTMPIIMEKGTEFFDKFIKQKEEAA